MQPVKAVYVVASVWSSPHHLSDPQVLSSPRYAQLLTLNDFRLRALSTPQRNDSRAVSALLLFGFPLTSEEPATDNIIVLVCDVWEMTHDFQVAVEWTGNAQWFERISKAFERRPGKNIMHN